MAKGFFTAGVMVLMERAASTESITRALAPFTVKKHVAAEPEDTERHHENGCGNADFRGSRYALLALNAVSRLHDLSPLKSVGLHKLKGARRNQWAMSVNDRWRICFEFRKGDAHNVEIVDYHKG